jgi:hypothetical protein
LHPTIEKEQTMRKFTASVLATAVLTGGVLSGAALAAPAPSHPSAGHVASVDRSSSKHRENVKDRSRHESASRDRTSPTREHSKTHNR